MVATPELDVLGTIVTPVSIETSRLEVRAEYFNSPIDLDLLRARYRPYQVLSADPLVLKLAGNAHVVVLRFGAVVFWDCDGVTRAEVLGEVRRLPDMGPASADVRDEMLVLTGEPDERMSFREIRLKTLSLEHIKIVSEMLGQSVALKHSELSVSRALKNTTPIVHALEARGALIPSAQTIVRTVGFTLSVREAILARLSLFDDPAETWRSERLARLHGLLYDHFDIKKRLSAVQEKVTFLSDLNTMLMNLLQNRTSHRLEWIVILLIVIEVAFSFIHFFSNGH
ncbi:MAG TPA: RMD1 family protein [Gemmataceae bacterium]|nr:RMD1 family protein [Gemmataceae bacterium]